MISANITASLYLVTGILFIMALRGLSSPETSRTGNFLGILGMGLAVIVTLLSLGDINQIKENIFYILIPIIIGGLVGGIIAFRVSMTAMPQLVAGFHSLVGLSAVLVGIVAFYNPASFGIGQVGNIKILSLVEMSLGVAIGAITFSGSCIAFLKLQGLMSGNPITFKGQHLINLFIGLLIIFLIFSFTKLQSENLFWAIIIISTLGGDTSASTVQKNTKPVKQGGADDAAFLMKNASSVIIVPGYGMAVAQAQHALREMADKLKKLGVKVSYAIHPVAGRMPGHMNVLLAEANVPYDEVFELENINNDFSNTDVSFVIGANDVTNPAAKTDPKSPIFGMPILDVEKSKSVLFVKRGMAAGYAGVDNELFYKDNTLMLFSDAKKMVEEIIKNLD